MRGIPEDKAVEMGEQIDSCKYLECSVKEWLRDECQELQEPWIPLEEFLRSGFVGKCWLGDNISGAVTCAYYYSGAFCKDNSSCGPKYISAQSVTHVMPIHKPEPPR